MDLFKIKQYRSMDEGRLAEHKLKRIGVQVVLSGSAELYVSTEHLDKALDVLNLPSEVKKSPQPGPWCHECGHQLVSRKGRLSGTFPWIFLSKKRWYCHGCGGEIKKNSLINRLGRAFKKTLVNMGYHSKPDFIIIGAQKAGTSAVFKILQQHPQILASRKKELRFFDDYLQIKYGDFVSYHEMFPLPYQLQPDRLTFEASPSYLFNPVCARRIYQYSPGIRLIAILRDPISRAFSAWKMHRRFAQSTNTLIRSLADRRSFEEAIRQEIEVFEETAWEKTLFAYIKRGIYIEQLERYLQYFSRDSLLILEHSHLLRDPEAVFASMFRFLGIDDQFAVKPLHVNVATNNEEIPKDARDILHSIYKPYNQRLFSLLGREYDW